ncbi:MAG: biosynthetic peptidoglycan transglycosylase [Chloroflexota bacterium]
MLILLGAAWIYLMRDYGPGLRTEAARVPAMVQTELAQQHAPYTPSSQISPYLQNAIVSIEDRRFYSHPGFDPLSMVRAVWVNLTNGHIDQGGSTLEEQLVKRTLVPNDRTVRGKVRTIALAWAIDQDFSKQRVIELYLNDAYYGQGAYGAQQAARVYFGVDAANLTVPQAALLAALPQAPSVYGARPTSPVVRTRQIIVLRDMQQLGYLTPAQERLAETTTLSFALPNP